MNIQTIENRRIGEKMYYVKDKTGLDMYVIPKPGHSKTYAIFATKYGSIDSSFRVKGESEWINVPDGIAHFLEHKLFEKEDGDAFTKYAKYGADANAFTSFNKTAYLFSCTENFEPSLEILFDVVQRPYFTPQSVAKEQGIIGQEINMGVDSPDWQVLYGLLDALFFEHPVKREIAGTIESIYRITPELLYKCHELFYNPHNMVLCVCGDVNAEQIFEFASSRLVDKPLFEIERGYKPDKGGVNRKFVEKKMAVSCPIFYIGVKDMDVECIGERQARRRVETDILIEILTGEGSELYSELYDSGLINSTFGYEYYGGSTFGMTMIGGESREPEKVYQKLEQAIERLKKGINQEDFERAKRVVYGRGMRAFNNVERVAVNFVECWAAGMSLFDVAEAFDHVTLDSTMERLNSHFTAENMAMCVVRPLK